MKKTKKSSILRLTLVVLSAILLLGMLSVASFAADVAEVRYQIDGGDWTEATFADAITAVAGETATIELQKDVTLTAGVTVAGGDLTVQSSTAGSTVYSIKRGSTFATSMFTVNGATLTFKNITLDGGSHKAAVNGAMVALDANTDKVVLGSGTTIQNSVASGKFGGAIYATLGTIEIQDGATIKGGEATKGGAIALAGTATLNMSGGLITGCSVPSGDWNSGAAVYLEKGGIFNMSGGVITGNTSGRKGNASSHSDETFIDGAVAALSSSAYTGNRVNLSGTAVIWDNTAYKYDKDTNTVEYAVGGDLVFTTTHYLNYVVNVAADFTGLVGFAADKHIQTPSTSNQIAKVSGTGLAEGNILSGLVDTNRGNVAIVKADGYIGWTPAEAEVDTGDGLPRRYTTLADALTAASKADKATVAVLQDITLTAGTTITGGNITVQSKGDSIYTLTRGSSFTNGSMFTVKGGNAETTLTFANITLDGNENQDAGVNGGMVSLTGANDKVVLNAGATIQYSGSTSRHGGAIYAPMGTVEMNTGSAILNCKGNLGGGIYLGHQVNTSANVVFNMNGGLIKGCECNTGFGSGPAVYMRGHTTFNMAGGLITGNTSYRNGNATNQYANTFVDGAVSGLVNGGHLNKITISGNPIIRDNYGYFFDGNNVSETPILGADLVYTYMHHDDENLTVASDFVGSFGFSSEKYLRLPASNPYLGTAGGGWEDGAIIPGLVDSNTGKIAKVSGQYIILTDAVAEVDYEGKITRYPSLEAAYAEVGDKAPIKLLANVTDADLFLWADQKARLILNGFTVSFTEGTECSSATATEKVGAYTYATHTYEGVDAEVTTYTATKVPHVCETEGATGTTPVICSCGKISAFPTSDMTVRYSTDGGVTWTYGWLASALNAVSGETAIIELYRDVAISSTLTVNGDITIRSLPGELNGVDGDKIYTIQRATYTSFSMFKVGSGKLTFADITLDGNGASLTASVTGAVVSFAATGETTDTVVFDRGTTVQNSKSNASGGVVYAAYGHVVMNDGAVIRDCIGQKGAAIFLGMNNGNNGKTYATFTMNGGIITGCKASHISGTSHGAAVYMEGAATFTMKGGLIAGNISERTSMMSGQEEDVFIDGAVGFIRGQQCKVYLSGDATIRNNYGKIKLGSAYSNDLYFGADLVLHADHRSGESLNIAAGFTGSVGVSFPTTGKIANVATDYEVGTVLNGIVDANTGNVAKVTASGTLKWAPAEAEVDVNGKVMRYETVDEAYAVAGSENPIKLVSDATITVLDIGDTAKIVENGYSLIVKSNGSFEKSEGEEISFGTITFKGEEFAGETLTAVTYTITEGGQITNVALSAGTDLSLYFYANMGSRFADSVLRVTRGSNTTELTSTYDEALGLYRFVYSDIAPQCAGDAISVELVNGEDVLFTYDNYSILSYCQQVLAMDAASLGFEEEKCEELKTLLRDLLTYCASAQTYLGYNTDALVNEGIKGSTFVLPAYTPKSTAVHNKVEGVTFTLAGLRFYNVNNLWFEFTTTDPAKTTVDINGKIYTSDSFVLQSGNTYRVYAEDLYAIQFDQAFVAKLSFDGTLLQTLHYSVGAYVHSLVTAEEGEYTEAAINLAKATYNYGVAARIWADRYAATTHTAGTLVSTHGANTLGGAAIKNGVLVMDQPASGIEFTFRGKGDVVLNLTAEEAARIEVMVDGQVLPHFLVSAGTADYTVKTGLADGKHTVRIVQENGAVTLNSANVKGYFTAPEAQTKDLFIEFVGSDALLGHNLFLNYSSYEDDATGAYAVLAARELGARYLISDTDKVFAATADAPDLVVIDFENGFDYTDLLADIRAAYGAGVEILFVGCVEQISAMDESFINLTKDTSGIDEYPSAGGAAIQGAELAKHIRESYDFFTADEIAEAKKDIIVEVTSTNATSGYNPFYVYIRTSDPSGKYYIRYNFTHQYDINRTNYNGSSTTNISNFRILGAHLVEVTDVNENAVTCNPVLYVLGTGEISTALKTMSNTNGTSSGDFTGGLHGDEWIRGVDGTDGHLTDAGWIPAVALLADGVEIDIVGGEAKVITCNTLTFDQTTMMYEWGTSSNDPTDDIEKRGTPLVIHTQHFTITQESGIQNRQSYTWLKDVGIDTSSNYLLMFTMNRFDGAKDVCTEMEVFNTDCVSNGTESAFGKLDVSSISVLHNATSRFIHYGGDSGVTSYARYDLCNVGKFSDNSVTLQDIWVSIRNGESSADNKLYVRFKSSDGEANKVAEGDFWTLDVAYNIDYVNPNN